MLSKDPGLPESPVYSLNSKGCEKSWVAEMSNLFVRQCDACLLVPVPIQGPDAKLILDHGGGKERSPVQAAENRNCFWSQDWRKQGENSASQFSRFKHLSFLTHTKSHMHISSMKLTQLSPWERTTESSTSPVYKNFMAGSVHLQWDTLYSSVEKFYVSHFINHKKLGACH